MSPEALVALLIAELGPDVVRAIRDVLIAGMKKEPYLDVDRPKALTIDDNLEAIDRRVAREGVSQAMLNAMDAALDEKEWLSGENG